METRKGLNINRLTFGSDDAELDEKRGFLDRVFLKTSVFYRVREKQREIVLGRKGSGKSAICLILKKALEEENVTTVLVTPQSLSQSKLKQLKTSSINRDETYMLGWKYALLATIGLKVIELEESQDQKLTKDALALLRRLKSFLSRNGEIEKTFLQRLLGVTSIFSKVSIKILGVEGSAETRQLQAEQDMATELERFQTDLEAWFAEFPRTKLVVLIDKADEVWNQTEESELMIIGLVKAVHDLNSQLRSAHFVLFLRSDIYDTLQFNDADKLHGGEERIRWQEDNLKHLITTRARVSAELTKTDTNAIWDMICDSQVGGIDSFHYILNRSLKRPRELIQFCNAALAEAQDKGHTFIKAEDIQDAEETFSNWKLKDLISEFAVQYPYLEDLLGLFQGYKVRFANSDFVARFAETKEKLANPEVDVISPEKILQILYIIGFLGAQRDQQDVYIYDDRLLILSKEESIVVHPAYHLALGLSTEPQKTFPKSMVVGRDVVVIGDYNVAGDIVTGDKVIGTRYDETLSINRRLESLWDTLEALRSSEKDYERRLSKYSETEAPVQLLEYIAVLKRRILQTQAEMDELEDQLNIGRKGNYKLYATSRTPALIVFLFDVSVSMGLPLHPTGQITRIEAVSQFLKNYLKRLTFRSTKGNTISPRYRLAALAYSDAVVDLLGGIRSIEELIRTGIPTIYPKGRSADTAKGFEAVEFLLRRELPDLQSSPAPLVCHITDDGWFTGLDPLPIAKRIMDLSVPDGNILIENICIRSTPNLSSDSISDSLVSWPGIKRESQLSSDIEKHLFSMSSPIPKSYLQELREYGFGLEPGARLFFRVDSLEQGPPMFIHPQSTRTTRY